MRRVFIFLLILSLTSVAGAALQISVKIPAQPGIPEPIDYGYDPPDSLIFLYSSQHAILDIGTNIPITCGGEGEGLWALTCQTYCGAISGGVVVIQHPDWEIGIEGPHIIPEPPGYDGLAGWIFTWGKDIPAGTILDEIIFHCECTGVSAVVTLWQLDAVGNVSGIWDTVTIHLIPEPASMLLLGLGGLTMRRINRRERKER